LHDTLTHTHTQGFWDMVYFQVEDVDKKFEQLSELERNGWKQVTQQPKGRKAKVCVFRPISSNKVHCPLRISSSPPLSLFSPHLSPSSLPFLSPSLPLSPLPLPLSRLSFPLSPLPFPLSPLVSLSLPPSFLFSL